MKIAVINYRESRAKAWNEIKVVIPSDIRDDRNSIMGYCSDFIEDHFGPYRDMYLDEIIDEAQLD